MEMEAFHLHEFGIESEAFLQPMWAISKFFFCTQNSSETA